MDLSLISDYDFRDDDTPIVGDLFQISIKDESSGGYYSTRADMTELVNGFPTGSSELIDENDMSSNSDQHVPTQRSVKEYVDNSPIVSRPSNTPIQSLLHNIEYTNDTGRRLIVVAQAYSSNDLRLLAYIGENETTDVVQSMVVISDGGNLARCGVTFIVPKGWKYRIYVDNYGFGGTPSVQLSQAWEIE